MTEPDDKLTPSASQEAMMTATEEIDLVDLVRVLRASWRRILRYSLGFALIGALCSLFLIPRKWQSTTRLLLPQPLQGAGVGQVALLPGGLVGGGGASGSGSGGLAVGGGGLSALLGGASNLGDTFKSILESDSVRETLATEFKIGKRYRLKYREERLKAMGKMISVKIDGKSGLISISATAKGSPRVNLVSILFPSQWGPKDIKARRMSAGIAARSVGLLQDYLKRSNLFQSQKYRLFVEEQVEATYAELKLAQQRLQEFQQQKQIISPAAEAEALIKTLQQLFEQKTTADVKAGTSQDQIATVADQLKAQAQTPLSLPADSPIVQQWRRKLIEQQTELSILRKDLTDSHPDVVRLQLAIDETKKQLREEVTRVLKAADEKLSPQLTDLVVRKIAAESESKGLSSVISVLQSKVASMPPAMMTYTRFKGDAEVLERRYRLLNEELVRARMAEAKEPSGFVLLDRAVVPTLKASPSTAVNSLVAAILGLMISIFVVFAGERAAGQPPVGTRSRRE
ncbi:MAG: hypothetical protein HY318_18305 [Armatimonadetes bacterium]|nr:hypothetical protein [Armatimonadota bacterium]